MAYQPFSIVPFKHGLNIDDEPFLIPMDGAQEFNNGHIKHGAIEKRAGYVDLASMADGTDVMGIYNYYDNTNVRDIFGFSQKRIYELNKLALPYSWNDFHGADIFTSGDSDFVWAVNWQSSEIDNRLYFTNGKTDSTTGLDGIWYWDGVAGAITQISDPAVGTMDLDTIGTRQLRGCKLLFVLKQRLLCLNTYERDATSTVRQYPQRLRWCQAQGPSNWDDVTPGGGGYVDAPTGEHIISARALQNSIIVYFTNSVWSIEPTTDPALPFRWKKINDFRACGGKMATAGFDRYVFAVGNRGLTATDGIETRRIDDRISNFVDDYINNDSFTQVFCLRDFNEKRLWTLYPRQEDNLSSAALIYDEESSSWSIYDIDLNVLGEANNGFDWRYSDFVVANGADWEYDSEELGDAQYSDFFFQGNADYLIGGDSSGKTYFLETGYSDDSNSIDFEYQTGNWNPFQKEGRECQLGYVDFLVETNQETKFDILFYKNNDIDPYKSQRLDCLPDLGFIADIQDITQTNPGSVKAENHGLSTNDIVYIYAVEGMKEVNTGPFTITVVDNDNFTIGVDTSAYTAYAGDGMLFKRQFYRTKAWKRAYAGGIGYFQNVKVKSDGADQPLSIYEMRPYMRGRGKRALG